MLNDDSVDGNVKAKLASVVASNGWCTRFIKRNDLHSRVLYGQEISADVHGGHEKMMESRAQLKNYQIEHIYNVEETALFLKSLPRHTYVFQN